MVVWYNIKNVIWEAINAMGIHQKKKILFAALLILLILASIFGGVFSKEIALSIIIPLLIIWVVLYTNWWKCPHCNRSLGRLELGVTHCKYCGKELK